VRPNGIAAIHVKPALVPIHHSFDDNISDFDFGYEHFEHFIATSAAGGRNLLD
jgi:hypothetical protein